MCVIEEGVIEIEDDGSLLTLLLRGSHLDLEDRVLGGRWKDMLLVYIVVLLQILR